MRLTLRWAAATDTGHARARNEDAAYAGQHLLAVADGLGGHVAGDTASATVIDALRRHDRPVPAASLTAALSSAIAEASGALTRAIASDPELSGMGTTLVALLHSGTCAALASIGDSRAYLLRAGYVARLTEDHHFRRLVASAELVPGLPGRLARYLDGRPDGRSPDLIFLSLQPGDRLLLCSDGLSAVVPAPALDALLAAAAGPAAAVRQLLHAASAEAGGPDNITLIVADLTAAEPGQDFTTAPLCLGAAGR